SAEKEYSEKCGRKSPGGVEGRYPELLARRAIEGSHQFPLEGARRLTSSKWNGRLKNCKHRKPPIKREERSDANVDGSPVRMSNVLGGNRTSQGEQGRIQDRGSEAFQGSRRCRTEPGVL